MAADRDQSSRQSETDDLAAPGNAVVDEIADDLVAVLPTLSVEARRVVVHAVITRLRNRGALSPDA
jgi:hypothetical protein